MNKENIQITIIIPALNEEKNILSSIDETLGAFKKFNVRGEIVVINDGSTDLTSELVNQRIKQYPAIIRMLTHKKPNGLGASFWDGVDHANGDAVCMLPGDNENDPLEIMRYLNLLDHVDMIIPFVFNRNIRPASRVILSFIYRYIINNTFLTSLNYTNGSVIYRKSILDNLDYRCSGFFFTTDIIIRLIKRECLFAEVPYKLRLRKEGKSKALSLKSLRGVMGGYLKLFAEIYFKKKNKKLSFVPDSATAKRYH